MAKPRRLLPVVLASFVLLGACAGRPIAPACPGQSAALRLELYFGLSKPDGSLVGEVDWQRFHEEVVVPAFPDGLTVLEGRGHWRDDDGRLWEEPSRLLIVLAFDRADLEETVERVVAAYKSRFQQQAVLVVESPACVEFR